MKKIIRTLNFSLKLDELRFDVRLFISIIPTFSILLLYINEVKAFFNWISTLPLIPRKIALLLFDLKIFDFCYQFESCNIFNDYLGITLVPIIILLCVLCKAYTYSVIPPLHFYLVDLIWIFNPGQQLDSFYTHVIAVTVILAFFVLLRLLMNIKVLRDEINIEFDEVKENILRNLEKLKTTKL